MKPTFYMHGKEITEKDIGEFLGCKVKDWCLREAYKLFMHYDITETNWVGLDGITFSIQFSD